MIRDLLNNKYILSVFFWLLVFLLAVFQDYIFSELRNTGFYLSESLLYNTYWVLFIPFTQLSFYFYRSIKVQSLLKRAAYLAITGVLFSLIQSVISAWIFTQVSDLLFSSPHYFSSMLKSVISNHLYLTILVYSLLPVLNTYLRRNENQSNTSRSYKKTLSVKHGTKTKLIDVDTIQSIEVDKPYVMIHSPEGKFLYSGSLRKVEAQLDPEQFFRVHRSIIVNKDSITEINSRKNGDFDAAMSNGDSIRLSRHYRKNWEQLLLH